MKKDKLEGLLFENRRKDRKVDESKRAEMADL